MRFRRLRSGTLAVVRLRRRRPIAENPDVWPHPGLADREPPRPHPAANAWPDDAVTVTYAELRRLVALHLELCSATMPRDAPWDWMRMRAGAVRDGETPLLLSEVMEP